MLKRASRIGQTIRIPILCDPEMPEVTDGAREFFAATLDAAALGVDLSRVSHAVIRGLSGPQMADAQIAAMDGGGDDRKTALRAARAIVDAGLVSIDGLPNIEEAGPLYLPLVFELSQRITAWSTLGEPAGSPSAPSPGGPC